MWPDNQTERDFLNISRVADTVAEIIVQARGRPAIGVSGISGNIGSQCRAGPMTITTNAGAVRRRSELITQASAAGM
jgi:hypothetical protein